MQTIEKLIEKLKLNPPYDCPYYFSNWNCDDSCKYHNGDYCSFSEHTGCPIYNEIIGIILEECENQN